MFRLFLVAIIQFGSWQLIAQTNLVPNPSFEQNVGCPTGNYEIWRAEPWVKVGGDGGMSYFNDCGVANYQSVSNVEGWGGARTGVGMVDIVLAHNNHVIPFHAEGNFLGAPLLTPLSAGSKYKVRFFLSLTDFHRMACKNVGVHFSVGQPLDDTAYILSLVPQVRYTGDFLLDKIGWLKIEGEFIAQGDENFITLGNFDGYANSDTLNLHEGGTLPSIGYWETALYFLDDVSVTEVDTTVRFPEAEVVKEPAEVVGVEEKEVGKFGASVHPNPAKDQLNIMVNDIEDALWRFEMFTPLGQRVAECQLRSGQNPLDISTLKSGIYHWRVFRRNDHVNNDKIILIK